ncbi:hypothetical protein [Staphylococcus americanisciuri]|uniref:Transposase n=1 Tax=Staphylococcus americanisciuri TaxID=2973940 RepID=A0ABT2EZS8_9STAP|nr:hypothetical protein [Staphylococcus americanisciuri]MCS4485705.1 hypothetical protein [Staphylococcus americanisciuri]
MKTIHSSRRATDVSRDLDIPIQTLTKWLSIYRKDGEKAFVGSGQRTQRNNLRLTYKKD